MKWLKIGILSIVLLIFIYLRIMPIFNQTVPYTYDQGRDFLKASEIIKNKDITFIGPTTGIQGVYHGAWWYYFLALIYLVFNGWPLGYYLTLFVLSSTILLAFYLFINKEFGWKSSLLFLLIVSGGSFFSKLAFFVSNNTLSPLFLLSLIYFVYLFFKIKLNKYIFFIFLSLGFIFEFEVAFGIFVILSFFITSLFFKPIRNIFFNLKKSLILISGFIIPFLPRLLFELKNNFIQTKAFLSFYLHPTMTNKQSFFSTIIERLSIFLKYYLQIIPFENTFIGLFIFGLFLFLFIKNRKTINPLNKSLLIFFSLLLLTIFLVSLLSRNNFFWDYYLDGLQFIILFIVIIIFSLKNYQLIKNIIMALFITSLLINFYKAITIRNIPLIGLRADNKIINYFTKKYKNNYFCLKIYTPPVIPFTYMYLLSYYADQKEIIYPKGDFYENQCYFIIDKEPYQFRLDKWREENIPKNTKLKNRLEFENGTKIELWSFKNNQ